MKKLALLLLLFLTVCCKQTSYIKTPTPDLISHLNNSTIALVDDEGDSFCTGVWINEDMILTAAHCVADEYDEADLTRVFNYKTYDEFTGDLPKSWTEKTYHARITVFEKDTDLAVLRSINYITHHIATIRPDEVGPGEFVQILGHPFKLAYTHSTGTMARIRSITIEENKPVRIVYHLNVLLFPGDSGGGAFDAYGNLIGISSFYMPRGPGYGFVISNTEILRILDQHKVKYF